MTFTHFVFDKVKTPRMRGCEVGVRDGVNAARLIDELPVDALYLVDNFPAYDDYGARDYTEEDQRGEYAKLIKMLSSDREIFRKTLHIYKSSMDAYQMFLDYNPTPFLFDFVYIDADHSYERVKEDLRWWNLVRAGGVLGGHDFGGAWGEDVKKAVEEFAAENRLKVNELDTHRGGVEWAIIK